MTKNSGFVLGLKVSSALPRSDLVLRVRIYPRLESRYALDNQPLSGAPEQTITNVAVTGRSQGAHVNGILETLHFRTITTYGRRSGLPTALPLHLNCIKGTCNGDYPISIVLSNRITHHQMASLVTTLIYLGGQLPTQRLDVALVLPLDVPVQIIDGNATSATVVPLPATAIKPIATVANVLLAYPGDPVSLDIYPRLLNDLQQTAGSGSKDASLAIQALTNLQVLVNKNYKTRQLQLVGTTFAPIDLTALVNGLGFRGARQVLTAEQTASRETLFKELHTYTSSKIFLTTSSLTPQAAKLIGSTGTCQVVLPISNIAISEQGKTADASFTIANTASSCGNSYLDAEAADSAFAARFANASTTPQLAAHQLLADLAQTYFEDPYAPQQRGVVVAPSSWTTNATFLSTLLLGLTANPILEPMTLSNLFAAVPAGANNEPTSTTVTSGKTTSNVDGRQLARAMRGLDILQSIVPTATALHDLLIGQLFNGESPGLTSKERARFFSTPKAALAGIAKSLHLSGEYHVTFTAATGKIPITIHYTGSELPVTVEMRIKSSSIDFPGEEAHQKIVLHHRDTAEVLKVSTRTSGVYTFTLALYAPNGAIQLLRPSVFTITSTAASGVAIALSVAALSVLGLWWSRSILRHRREKRVRTRSRESEPSTT